MKKIVLALLCMGTMFVAQAAPKETPKMSNSFKMEKKSLGNKYVWELRFTCDGGATWGTVCCFNTSAEAMAFWNQNSGTLCGWTQS